MHVSCRAALDEIGRAREAGEPVFAETCPHFLALDESRYDASDEECARYVISPPLRTPDDRAALWDGAARRRPGHRPTDHVPDRLAVDKRLVGQPFNEISNGGPGIETLLSIVYSEGVSARACHR